MEIYNYIKEFFPNRTLEQQSSHLSEWKSWYEGYLKSFHEYRIYTGSEYVTLKKKSLNIAKKSCEDWANLLLNEKCSITVKDQETLDEILKDNNFWVRANNLVETSFALSMGAFVESLENVSVVDAGEGKLIITKTANSKVKIDYVNALNIYPITFKDGKLVECAFASEGTNEVYVSIHKLNEKQEYEIINCTYNKQGETLTEKSVYTFYTGSTKPLYQIVKPNICNNLDVNSPLGISIYANAINTLMAIDNAYDSFDTEIQYGRKRIIVDNRLINVSEDGQVNPTFDPTDVVFYTLPPKLNGDDKDLIQEISSPLRTDSIAMALQEQLNVFSASAGFGKNYYTFGNSGGGRPIQTATGIVAQNSDLFRSIRKHEILLEQAIVDMVDTIAYLTNNFTTNKLDAEEVVVQFDDSIIEDTESQKASDRTDVQNGVMSKVEYRMKWYGEDEDVATEKLEKFSLDDLDVRINALLTGLQSGAISPDEFAKQVYKGKDDEFITKMTEYITASLEKSNTPLTTDMLGLNVVE